MGASTEYSTWILWTSVYADLKVVVLTAAGSEVMDGAGFDEGSAVEALDGVEAERLHEGLQWVRE